MKLAGDRDAVRHVWVTEVGWKEYRDAGGELLLHELRGLLKGLEVFRVREGSKYYSGFAAGFVFTFYPRTRKKHGSGGAFTLVNVKPSS